MMLGLYLVIALIILGILFYKFNKKKYKVYFLITIITGILGFFFELTGIVEGDWVWGDSLYFLMGTPIEMIIIYFMMGAATALLTLYFKDIFRIEKVKDAELFSLALFIVAFASLITIFVYEITTTFMIFFLFMGGGIFMKYRNPIIIAVGLTSAAMEIFFDTFLIIFGGYSEFSITIPYADFFIMAVFFSGLTIFLNEKIYSKK